MAAAAWPPPLHADGAAAAAAPSRQALALCLQQPATFALHGLGAVKLACASKGLAEQVAHRYAGALGLTVRLRGPAQAQAFAAWLARHGGLLAAVALAPPSGLAGGEATQAVLDALPTSLSRLALERCESHHMAAVAAALERLPALGSVALAGTWATADTTPCLLAALAPLTGVTALTLPLPRGAPPPPPPAGDADAMSSDPPAQAHLPPQLVELELLGGWRASTAAHPWLASWLGVLPGLTRLHADGMRVGGDAVLPDTLARLDVQELAADAVAPLLRLTRLTGLDVMRDCAVAAPELRRLSELAALRSVALSFSDDAALLARAAASFGALPLTQLRAWRQLLSAESLEHVGGCSRLTCIELHGCSLAPGAEALVQHLLARLPLLRVVRMRSAPSPLAAGAGWAVLVAALGALPQLRELDLSCTQLGSGAAALATAVRQLTSLSLWGAELDDYTVAILAGGLERLAALDLRSNSGLSDACLVGIEAAQPQQLMRLDCRHCAALSEAALLQLSAALPQLHVHVRHDRVASGGRVLGASEAVRV